MTTALKDAFEGKKYPQIRTIILPNCAHHILRACPEVRDVTCNEDDGGKLLTPMTKECRNVESIEGIYLNSDQLVKSESRFLDFNILPR